MSQASVDISSTTQTVGAVQKRIRKLKKLTTIDTLKLTGFLLYQRENNEGKSINGLTLQQSIKIKV
jgi:hypothetical protein